MVKIMFLAGQISNALTNRKALYKVKEKAVTLYKYISARYAEDILRNQHLMLDNGTGFNDPFELRVSDRRYGTDRPILGLRILCLTNSNRKKLMWSHYADSHKGLCLVVEVPESLVCPVCYSGNRIFEDSNIDDILIKGKSTSKKLLKNKPIIDLPYEHKVALIKDQKWEYEKEYRIVLDESSPLLTVDSENRFFFDLKIKRIYLGCRFEENKAEAKTSILSACSDNSIGIQRMYMSKENYAVKAEKVAKYAKPEQEKILMSV